MDYIVTQSGDFVSTDELRHWGIKGMKWGRRLYQNKDGSLTPLGKKRYAKEEAALKEREKVIKNREREAARRAKMDAKKAELDARENALNSENGKKGAKTGVTSSETPKKKSLSEMTDAELNDAINRARLEDTYRNLRPEPVAKPSFSKQLVSDVIKPAMMNSGRKALESIIDKSVKDFLKDKPDPDSVEALKKTYEKLDYKRKIEKLKKGEDPNEKPMSWEDKLKKQTWEKNERDRAAEEETKREEREQAEKAERESKEAEKKAKQEVKEAEKKAKQEAKEAEEQRRKDSKERQDEYYAYKESVRQKANDLKGKRKQEEYYERKEKAKDWLDQVREYDNSQRDEGEKYVQMEIDWDTIDETWKRGGG